MNIKTAENYLQILKEVVGQGANQAPDLVVTWMQKNIPGYDWVGYYMMDHETKTLHLGPYAGAATDHVEIPFGKGICGQVAVSGKTYITGDVTTESNYIACSLYTKSEIVVPMYQNGVLIGQIDIDSHTPNAFDAGDEWFLDQVNKLLVDHF
jgi:L-methionine (R)-S-oxide reductase